MSWFKRNKEGITTSTSDKKEVPEGLWSRCPKCKTIFTKGELAGMCYVCDRCGHHERIGSEEYFSIIFLILIVVFVFIFRTSDLQPYSISKDLNIKAERDITLEIGGNGETLILDQARNVLLSYSKEQENFVSTVTKVLERDRKKMGILKNSYVVLRLSQDNRLSIFDPQTEREIDLAGFGSANIQVFYDILK